MGKNTKPTNKLKAVNNTKRKTITRTKRKAAKRPRPNRNFTMWASKLLAGAVAMSYLMAVYFALKANIIPTKYMALILVATGCVAVAVVFANYKCMGKTLFQKLALIMASLIVITASLQVAMLGSAASNFLAGLQSGQYSYEEYSIIAKKGNGVELNKNNTSIGHLDGDINTNAVITEVKTLSSATPTPKDDIASLTSALTKNDVSTDVLRSSYMPMLQENASVFYESVHVLATFKVRVKNDTKPSKVDISKPFALYISGIDSYGEVGTTSRSDVNIIAVVNPKTKKILLVNTPRDYYVQLHGTSGVRDKLTHAGVYGINMSKSTLEDLYGISIDYYLRINFTSLLNIVDTIGGVEVSSDYDFTSGKYRFYKGQNSLNGAQALEFSRNRYAFEDGDRQRGRNQQKVIEAIIAKSTNVDTLLNYQNILKSLIGTFQTNASEGDVSALIKQQLNSLGSWQVESISVDGAGATKPTYSMGSMLLYVMEPDIATVNTVKAKIAQYLGQ